MTAEVVRFSAIRVAQMLRRNAPARSAAEFIAHMTGVARDLHDLDREAFWHEVADLVRRDAGAHAPRRVLAE